MQIGGIKLMYKPTIIKSILLVFIVYCSFILNNSISSIFVNEKILYSIILSIVLAELIVISYREILSNNNPGIAFYFCCLAFLFIICLLNTILLENFVIFVGLFVYYSVISLISILFPLDEQIIPELLFINDNIADDIIFSCKKGLLFNDYNVSVTKHLGFITKADRRGLFEIIKNNNGWITMENKVSVQFVMKAKELKFFNHQKKKLILNAGELSSIVENLLIEN